MTDILKENLTLEDLDEAIKETSKVPAFLTVHNCLKHQRFGTYPECEWRSFWMKNAEGKRIDFVARRYAYPGFRNFLMICADVDAVLDKEAMFQAFQQIERVTDYLFHVIGPVVVCTPPVTSIFVEWLENAMKTHKVNVNPCIYFYMPENQRNLLMEECKNGIPIHEDYYWDVADPDRDTQTFFDTWPHSRTGDYETIRDKLRNLPSSMIREKSTDKAVSFEMLDGSGFLNHLFTFPEHRMKGLGTATEKGICKKLIEMDSVPFKTVMTTNTDVVLSSEKSPYWTKWVDEEGNPVIISFIYVS